MNRAANLKSSTVVETRTQDQTDSRLRLYLSPAEFIDSDHERIQAKARQASGPAADRVEQARVLYRAVRDEISVRVKALLDSL